MPKRGMVSMNLDKLESLYQSLKTAPHIEVGVFSSKNGRPDAMTNATLAAIHEYGAPEHNLPARSMLRVPISDHAKEIMAVARGKAPEIVAKAGAMKLWKLIGIAAEKVVLGAFNTGGYGKWVPLNIGSVWTKLTGSLKKRKATLQAIKEGKKHDTILVDTGEMRRSFSSRVRMGF